MKTGLGQDSHAFDFDNSAKKLVLGGVVFENHPALKGNSDADVVLHAICNAISGITGVNILGKISDDLCQQGIHDSEVYLQKALSYLREWQISHVSISLECKTPKITPNILAMRKNIARILATRLDNIGMTATSGEGLTAFGRGEGIQALVIVSVVATVE